MGDTSRMEPVDRIQAIQKERWELLCSICRQRCGAKVRPARQCCLRGANAHYGLIIVHGFVPGEHLLILHGVCLDLLQMCPRFSCSALMTG